MQGEVRQVTALDAMRDLNRFLRDMYCWCDHEGSCTGGTVSVTRETIKLVRRVTDAILDNVQNGTPIYVRDGCSGVYEQLVLGSHESVVGLRKEGRANG